MHPFNTCSALLNASSTSNAENLTRRYFPQESRPLTFHRIEVSRCNVNFSFFNISFLLVCFGMVILRFLDATLTPGFILAPRIQSVNHVQAEIPSSQPHQAKSA